MTYLSHRRREPDPDEPVPPDGDPAPDDEAPEPDPPDDGDGDAEDVVVTGVTDGVEVTAPDGAGIYLDGRFTGESAPATVAVDSGAHTLGVGTDEDVEMFTEQMQATSDEMMVPFSYGTASWDITVLPMVEDVPLHRGSGTGVAPDGGRLIQEAGLANVVADYDLHAIFYGVLTADGVQVDDEPCYMWGGGDSVALNNGWNVRTRGAEPFEGFLHEALHVMEGRHGQGRPEPLTSSGLHGAQELVSEDGSPTSQWLNAYRLFMRSQIDEDGTYTGVFSTLRDGP